MRYLMVTGGTTDTEFAREYLRSERFDKIIAVDFGLQAVKELGLIPDYVIGDFDSVDAEILAEYTGRQGVETVRLHPEKDLTDTSAALNAAVDGGATELVILGGTGTRIDHVLANINILMKPLAFDIPAYLIDKYNKIYLINRNHVIPKEKCYGKYVSLFPLTEKVAGVCLRGFKYNLTNAVMTIGDSLGVSNEIVDAQGVIEIQEGVMIVVESGEAVEL